MKEAPRSDDAPKRAIGGKGRVVTDVLGLVLWGMATAASVQGRDGAADVVKRVRTLAHGPFHVSADGADAGTLVQ